MPLSFFSFSFSALSQLNKKPAATAAQHVDKTTAFMVPPGKMVTTDTIQN
jgi:hypothetical protein